MFDWRASVVNVRPSTVVRWHRMGWRIFWRRKCRAGRPPIPPELRSLIRRMAAENPLWGEERIANELLVKLGIRVSPRTVGKYIPKRSPGQPRDDQRWSTFLKNHAKAILACDFFIAVTATFRMLYVFVVIEHGTRRLAHINVTASPSVDSQRVGSWRSGSSQGICEGSETYVPTSLGGGCARPREIGPRRLASRILTCCRTGERVIDQHERNE